MIHFRRRSFTLSGLPATKGTMALTNSLQELYFQPYRPGEICFGDGEENSAGLQIKSNGQEENWICLFQPQPQHQSGFDLVCSGIIVTLIDGHCMASGIATAIKNKSKAFISFATDSIK